LDLPGELWYNAIKLTDLILLSAHPGW